MTVTCGGVDSPEPDSEPPGPWFVYLMEFRCVQTPRCFSSLAGGSTLIGVCGVA